MSALRLLAGESLDPDGPLHRWATPGLRRLGWEAWTLPTTEAVHLLGPSGYLSFVLQVVEQLRPHALLVNPPYDYLTADACHRIRGLGTRIIGLGLDDPLFEKVWGEAAWADLRDRLDVWATTALDGPTVAAGARSVLWTPCRESAVIDDPGAPGHQVVLLGRHTPERESLARRLAAAGLEMACYGSGWASGPVTRRSRLGLIRRAGVVITPCEGSSRLPDVMIDAALVGARQIIEEHDGLARYLPEANRPATYGSEDECVTRLTSGEPLPVWDDPPDWSTAWSELCGGLAFAEQPERTRSPALEQMYSSLAHVYEARGWLVAALACLDAWQHSAPDDWGPTFARARCVHAMRGWAEAARLAGEASAALEGHAPAAVTDVEAFMRARGPARGAGLSAALDPRVDMDALRMHALARNEHVDIAMDEVRAMSPAHRAAVHAAMLPDFSSQELVELARALGAKQDTE